ncbi:hypothetical protein C8R44DRAFT_893915 [Mycena epipterygia]|nr:hypothetical protein C8R44DRAFT_893915 [Mycena epipterygia]
MGLSELPPELKSTRIFLRQVFAAHFQITDLLTVSHVSQLWRSTVLEDKCWTQWFGMIAHPETEESAHDFMSRFKILHSPCTYDRYPLPFCTMLVTRLVVKHQSNSVTQRICSDCLKPENENHIVMCLTPALTIYDFSEKDVKDVVVLRWEEIDPERKTRKELSALDKHDGEEKLATHLEQKKARLRKAYENRLAEYNAATTKCRRLKKSGDAPGAAAVTLKNDNKVPKTRPRMPAILKAPFTPAFYQSISILPTNFLVESNEDVGAQRLVTLSIAGEFLTLENLAEIKWYTRHLPKL